MIRWLLIGLLVGAAFAADAPKDVYSESFRKGPGRITGQTLDLTLTAEQPSQEFKIADSNGRQRYVLRFVPDVRTGDGRPLGWFVRLVDTQHRLYESVLPTSSDLASDQKQAWWLDGRTFSKIPLAARRIFKVEQFYCVVQVKEAQRLNPGQPYLSRVEVSVQFTNTKP